MKFEVRSKHLLQAVLVSSLAFGSANAQNVRELGMGGALLPGPSLAVYNPAYTAYDPINFQTDNLGGIPIPLGLINFFLRPQMNPFTLYNNIQTGNSTALSDPNTAFDALAFYDQLTHLNSFIINPPTAPRSLDISYGSEGLLLTDENGKPIELTPYSSSTTGSSNGVDAANFTPTFRIGNFALAIGLFTDLKGPEFNAGPALSAALATGNFQLGQTYDYKARVLGSAGVSLGLAYSGAIPISTPETGDFTLYLGGRARGFYGLAYVDAQVDGDITLDSATSQPKNNYKTTTFVSYVGNGYGFGVNADLGVAADVPVGSDKSIVTFGIGVVNLVNYTTWSGTEITYSSDPGTPNLSKPASRTDALFNPLVTINAGYSFRVEELASRVFVAADVQFGQGKFAAHVGAEAKLGPVYARGGLGYDRGFLVGLGAGLSFTPNVGLDLALTTHTAPFTNHLDFGVAMAIRIGF
jgi:hypothetical protein